MCKSTCNAKPRETEEIREKSQEKSNMKKKNCSAVNPCRTLHRFSRHTKWKQKYYKRLLKAFFRRYILRKISRFFMVKSPTLAHFIAFYLLTYFFLLGNEIPSVSTTEVKMLQHGDSITIFCNINKTSQRTRLKRISWLKNGVVQQSVRNPDPDNLADSLAPLVIKNAAAGDGGNYSCELELRLRNIKPYNVSDSTMITGEYMMSLFCHNSCLLCWDRVHYIFHAWSHLHKISLIWDVIGCASGIPTRLIKYNKNRAIFRMTLKWKRANKTEATNE